MKLRFQAAALYALLAALILLSCTTDPAVGTSATELKFHPIADSLRNAGYDKLEITVSKPDSSGSVSLFNGALSADQPPGALTLPDAMGKSYRVVVRATKSADSGASFTKIYLVIDGTINASSVSVVKGKGGGGDPDAPTGVAIQPQSLSLAEGGTDSQRLTAMVMPYPTAKQEVKWSSSNPAVVSVDSTGMAISGVAGKASITARASVDTTKSAAIDVTVSKPLKADSVVVQDTLRIYTGMPAAAIAARMFPATVAPLLLWHSTREDVATVSADGKVTGLAAGQSMVWAQYKGDAALADTCTVTVVYDPPVLDVGKDISVDVGATVAFPISVSQQFGGVVECKWDLDGDSNWDSTSASIPVGLARKYTVAGDFTAKFSVKDLEGNVGTAKRLVRVGSVAPLVAIDSPKEGAYVTASPVTVAYRVNNIPLTRNVNVTREGPDTITIDTTINGAAGSASVRFIFDSKPPVVAITSPLKGSFSNKAVVAVAWKVDGQPQAVRLQDTLKLEGQNLIVREAVDSAGNKGADTVRVTLDTKPPKVLISSPASGTVTNKTSIAVVWSVDGNPQTTQLTDSLPVEGVNTIKRVYTDSAGNKDSAFVTVTRNSKAAQVVISSPLPGTITNQTSIKVVWSIDQVVQTANNSEALLLEGKNVITRSGLNALGNSGTTSVTVIRDTKAPVVAITFPVDKSTVTSNPVSVVWTVDSVSQSAQTSETMSAGDGVKTITRAFTDSAGNPGTRSITVTLDKDKPLAPVMNAGGTTPSPTNAAGVTWKWASGAAANGNGSYRYWLDTPVMPVNPTPVSGTSALVNGLADGTHTLYLQEGDDQGNWSPVSKQAIVVDRTGPAIAIDQASQTVADAAFNISAVVTDPDAVASVSVAGAGSGNGPMTLAAGKYTRALGLATGVNTLVVTAKDNLGNTGTASIVVTYTQPTVTITGPPNGFVTSASAITLSYTVGSGTTKTKPFTLSTEGDNALTTTEPGAANATIHVYYLPKVVFVRKGATGANDGTSWDDAYTDLSTAISQGRGQVSGNSVWVSEDAYAADPFLLAPGVSLFGGFSGSLTQRPSTPKTTLFTTLRHTSLGSDVLQIDGNTTTPMTVEGFRFDSDINTGKLVSITTSNQVTLRRCQFTATDYVSSGLYASSSVVTVDTCIFTGIPAIADLLDLRASTVGFSKGSITGVTGQELLYMFESDFTISGKSFVKSNNFTSTPYINKDVPSAIHGDPQNVTDYPEFQTP